MLSSAPQAYSGQSGPAFRAAVPVADQTWHNLRVERLSLTDFRCYQSLQFDCDAPVIALYGPNGAGKTNLLEAVSLLTPGRGLRRAKLGDLARIGGSGRWAVAARADGAEGAVELGTGLQQRQGNDRVDSDARDARNASDDNEDRDGDGSRQKRVVRIDGRNVSGPQALAKHLGCLWLTPQMDRLFVEGAGNRRRWLDRLVFGIDPQHGMRVSSFEKAMRERSKILRGGKMGKKPDPAWLTVLEARMASEAVAIAAARQDLVRRLEDVWDSWPSAFPRGSLSVESELDSWLQEDTALAVEERYAATLRESRNRDAESGGTRIGPQKADLVVVHGGKNMPAPHCSTGEQKALLISITLANARLQAGWLGRGPLILLDEVAAHLDEERRKALYDEITGLGLQAWLTGTDRNLFDALEDRAQRFRVDAATVTPDAAN